MIKRNSARRRNNLVVELIDDADAALFEIVKLRFRKRKAVVLQ